MLAAVAPCALLLSTRPPAWFGPVGSGSVESAAAALPAHENGINNWKFGSYFNVSRYLLWRVHCAADNWSYCDMSNCLVWRVQCSAAVNTRQQQRHSENGGDAYSRTCS